MAGKRPYLGMAAATDSSTGSCSGAVRLPRSPPLKVLAEQLRRDVEGAPGAWRLSRAAAGRRPLELAAVWMQGTMVAADGGEARLRDPSGAFSVCGLERVPRGRPCLVPGDPTRSMTGAGAPQPGLTRAAPAEQVVLRPEHIRPTGGTEEPRLRAARGFCAGVWGRLRAFPAGSRSAALAWAHLCAAGLLAVALTAPAQPDS